MLGMYCIESIVILRVNVKTLFIREKKRCSSCVA